MTLESYYRYLSDTHEWVGGILQDGTILLDLGVEHSEEEIKAWCREALAAYSLDPLHKHPIPDWYDRHRSRPN